MDLFETANLEERAGALVKTAISVGADAADAVVVRGISENVEVRDGKVEEVERAEGDDLGLRVFVGNGSAIVSTNDPDTTGFGDLAERAVAMARAAPENPHAGLVPPALLAGTSRDLDLVDKTDPGTARLAEMARTAEAEALGTEGISKSGGASASSGVSGLVLVTSTGFSGAYLRSHFGLSMTAIGGDGVNMERDHDWSAAVRFADLADPAAIGRTAAERARRRLSPRTLKTRKAPVIFENRVAGSLLSDLAGALNGVAIARGASFLSGRMGDALFPEVITIRDDPHRRRGLGSRPFDGEGVAGEAIDLVRDGRVSAWLLDAQTARQLGLSTNGRAARGVSSAPSPATTNLTLSPGTGSLEMLLSDAGTGLLVTSMFGRGVNLVTGDYSRGVSGLWFENGEIAYPVAGITIAGHLDDMFAAAIAMDDLEFRGATNAPSLFVGEMTIAGS